MCARLVEIYPSSAGVSLGGSGLRHCLLHAHSLLHQLVGLFLAPFRLRDVGQTRVDVDQEAIGVPWLEQLRRELVELARPAPVPEVVEDACEDGVAPRGVLGVSI